VLMGTSFWRGLFAWLRRAMEGGRYISPGDLQLPRLTDDPEEAIDIVKAHYNKRKHAANFM
jgi:predicted Rossmann-fold nucleotide-binding protein